jgi:hypothetical protein
MNDDLSSVEPGQTARRVPAGKSCFSLHVEEVESQHYVEPELLIREFSKALYAIECSHQKMKVEIQLPAYLWIMLSEVARSKNWTLETEIGERLFRDPSIRADWIAANCWERELWPKVQLLIEAKEERAVAL